MKKTILFLAAIMLCSAVASAQTTILNETFESGSGTSLSNWTFANGSQVNKWYVGTNASYSGSKSAYISHNSGDYSYNYGTSAVVHLYRNVSLPSSTSSSYQLSFNWLCNGESGYDYMQVFLVDATVTPTAGTSLSVTPLGTYNGYTTWQQAVITLPASSNTKRLVFSWKNDASAYGHPPAAIDNVVITTTSAVTPIPVTANLANAGTLQNVTNITIANKLTLTGNIDARDIKFMRDNMPYLSELDISGANIVAYSGTQGTNYGNNVTYPANAIPQYSFYNSSSQTGKTILTSVIIPNLVTSIGQRAFYNCTGLTSVSIPNSVTTIGYESFEGCRGLTSITIPNSVTTIGYDAFGACNLKKLILADGSNTLSLYGISTSSSGGVYGSFYNSPIDTLYLGRNISVTYDYSYNRSVFGSSIKEVSIGNSVTSIVDLTFYNCSGLSAVTIPNSVTSIGNSAFYNCSNIPSITINPRVTSIGYQAFIGCSRLSTVNFNATNCNFYSTSTASDNPFYNLSSITTLNIGANVTKIPWAAFCNCSGITSINIPNSVTNLGASAFEGCSGATSLTIGTGVTTIPNYAFYGCSNIPSVTINAGVTSIGYQAFRGCSRLSTVNFNATNCNFYSTSSASDNPFYNLSSITTLNIGANVTKIPWAAFCNCSGITSINIPNSVTNLGVAAFTGCSGATSLTIGTGITSIPDEAFYNCYSIPSITIPNTVTSIGYSAFRYCNGATTVIIPSSVSTINDYAFANCIGLTSVVNLRTYPQTITSYTFYNVSVSSVNLLVPQASISTYQSANYWRNFYIMSASVNVTFFKRNGTGNTTQSVTIYSHVSEPAKPTHPNGDYFYGWYTDSLTWAANTKWNFSTNTVNGNMNLYARWIPLNMIRVVTFVSNNGMPDVKDSVLLGETTTSFTPTRTGYGFTGWYDNNNTLFDFNTPITANITLTAHWVVNSLSSVNTISASNVTTNSAVLGGEIQGTGLVTCGVVYSSSQSIPSLTTPNTIKKTNNTPAMGRFTLNATGLTANTSYYTRAWATEGSDTAYGEVKFFSTRTNNSCYQIDKLAFNQSLPSFVDILVRVKDCNGKGVNYLDNSDFQVWENDELTKSSETHSYIRKMDEMPFVIKTTLALDITSSLILDGVNGIDSVKAAARRLVEQKEKNQEFSIIVFNEAIPQLLQNFTADKNTLISAINSIDSRLAANTTSLYDAYTMGLTNLPVDSITASFIRKGFMIVFTDGKDRVTGDPNEQQVLANAIALRQAGGQQVYVIGLGDVDSTILQQLATTPSDYRAISNISELESMFVQVQSEIMREANSLYLLNYLSPKRGGTYDLKLRIASNTNSGTNAYAQATFNATNFVSAQYGVYVNPYININGVQTGMYGINTGTYTFNNNDFLETVTYWSDVVPEYTWSSSDTNIVVTETVDYNTVKLRLKGSGTAVITVKDVNNYNYVNNGDNATIAPYNASAFQRSFTVISTGTRATVTFNSGAIHTVNFNADGGIPIPETQQISNGSKAPEPSIIPVKSGFEFLGWYNGSTQYNFNNTVTSNLNLSAHWLSISQIEGTLTASDITKDSVTISGIVEYLGQTPYTERGICYGRSIDPTIANGKQTITGSDTISIRFGGLSANTTYFIRSYAISAQDTVYGKYIVFTTRQATERYSITGYPPVKTTKPSFVEVLFSVKDNYGRGADYLENKDFLLKQNDIPTSAGSEFHRYINKMDAIPFKIQTVLMLDNSSSMGYADFERMKQAAVELIKSKHEKQYYAIYSFSDNAVLVQDFSNDIDTLVQYISRIKLGSSTTNLYNSYITGINYLPAEYSNKDSIQKCFFVMLSDGDETQHQYTAALAQTAITARGTKTAYMIGLGLDLNTTRMTALASSSANYYSATSITQIKGIFANIQNDIMREANSFYNLVCLTDKLNTQGAIKLELTIADNQYTAADSCYRTTFTSIRTVNDDVQCGVYLNVYENIPGISIGTINKYGIGMPDNITSIILLDTMGPFSLGEDFILRAVTYWADVKPEYVWTSSDTNVIKVEKIDFDKARLRFSGTSTDTVIISVKDVANYDLVASNKGLGMQPIPDIYNRFIRSIGVKGVIKQAQTLTWNQTFQNVTYGDVITLTAVASSNLPVSYSLSNPSTGTINGNILTITGLGTVTITASQNGNTFYHPATSLTKTLNAGKALLNITADNKTREYGLGNPQLTYSITGLKNNETRSVIDVLPTISTAATVTSTVGTYTITVQNASDNNYDFTYQNGTLTVNKAPLTITANNITREYGLVNPQLTYSITGFRNNETQSVIDVLPTISTAATGTSAAGTYTITVQDASDNNYDFTYRNGTLTVNKAPLTITADNKTRMVGEENPVFTFTYSGFRNNENEQVLDQLPTAGCIASKTSPAGFYNIVLGGGNDNNYAYNLVNGKLEVKQGTGIADIPVQHLRIFPNPTETELFIKSELQIKKVELYSLTGSLILSEINFNEKIDVSTLTPGVYSLKIYTDKGVVVSRIVKK
jgi:uncharacterized repeat protein (TIGR02543 family)